MPIVLIILRNQGWLVSQSHIRRETKWHKIRLGKCLYAPNQKSDPGGFIPHCAFLSLTSEMLWETDWHTSASSLVQRTTSRRSVSGLYKILRPRTAGQFVHLIFFFFSLWKWKTLRYQNAKKQQLPRCLFLMTRLHPTTTPASSRNVLASYLQDLIN